MDGVLYHNAFDENGKVVDIDTVKESERHFHSYTCIACGAEMIPRLGKEHAKHFAHKGVTEHCSSETYLHILAKHKLKEKFDNTNEFPVKYYRIVSCSDKDSCPFYNDEVCYKRILRTVDLKKHYDTCELEKPIGGFVADLLLTCSDSPCTPPVILEINVTHESTEEKKNSGNRIIEIGITSEEEIQHLLTGSITETDDNNDQYVEKKRISGEIAFYGFKRDLVEIDALNERHISKFYLFRSGKAYVTNLDDIRTCRESRDKDNDYAIFEISIDRDILDRPSAYDYGYLLARQNGIPVKTCQFCKYHKDGFMTGMGLDPIFCCLHKNYGTPENPEPHYAKACEYYREDRALMEDLMASIPPYQITSLK